MIGIDKWLAAGGSLLLWWELVMDYGDWTKT
jgi:hypothetical protein